MKYCFQDIREPVLWGKSLDTQERAVCFRPFLCFLESPRVSGESTAEWVGGREEQSRSQRALSEPSGKRSSTQTGRWARSAGRGQEPWEQTQQLLVNSLGVSYPLDGSLWKSVQKVSQSLASGSRQRMDMSDGQGGWQEAGCHTDTGLEK